MNIPVPLTKKTSIHRGLIRQIQPRTMVNGLLLEVAVWYMPSGHVLLPSSTQHTPWKTNMSPENQWLEDVQGGHLNHLRSVSPLPWICVALHSASKKPNRKKKTIYIYRHQPIPSRSTNQKYPFPIPHPPKKMRTFNSS